MDDVILRRDIIVELDRAPKVDSAGIGVAVVDGIAILSGHVRSYAQRTAAEAAAKRVRGLKAIAVEIEIRPSGAASLSDEDIACRTLALLKWLAPPTDPIEVVVSRGWITLSGEVQWGHQSHVAEKVVRGLHGVKGVTNAIKIRPETICADIAKGVRNALERNASIEVEGVKVEVEGARVKLLGQVCSSEVRDAINRAAWAASGVRAVEDHISID